MRALASCLVDGELAELDELRLRRHLADCGACAVWASQAEFLAGVLRTREWEVLSRPLAQVSKRRRSRSAPIAATVASAAVAGLAALALMLPGRVLLFQSSRTTSAEAPCPWCMSHAALASAVLSSSAQRNHALNPVVRPNDGQAT